VRAQIERQLAPQVRQCGTRATVDEIEVAHYDGNADYMQPVYYFEATVESAEKRISDIKTAGYVPSGKALEPIPDLAAAPSGERPGVTKPGETGKSRAAGTPEDITLGEFVNQEWPTSSAYLDMANTLVFRTGLGIAAGVAHPVVDGVRMASGWSAVHGLDECRERGVHRPSRRSAHKLDALELLSDLECK
jgi:hypothetical protein